jgi:hypothetical protein
MFFNINIEMKNPCLKDFGFDLIFFFKKKLLCIDITLK